MPRIKSMNDLGIEAMAAIKTILHDYQDNLPWIEEIGPAGHVVVLSFTRRGPEWMESTFPDAWQQEYDKGNYLLMDPVLHRAVAKSDRDWRWSDISKAADLAGIMKKAKKHGLIYGAIFTRSFGGQKCFFSVSRSDREITDDEMNRLGHWFSQVVLLDRPEDRISNNELDVLRWMAEGFDNYGIAERLETTVGAIKSRQQSIRHKLGAKTNSKALAVAFRTILIT